MDLDKYCEGVLYLCDFQRGLDPLSLPSGSAHAQLYLGDFVSQFKTTGGSQERNFVTSVNVIVTIDAPNISNSALLGLSFIFFVSKPPAKLPMQMEISPVTAEKEIKHIWKYKHLDTK